MRFLAAVFALLSHAAFAQARDLPDAEFALLGPALPSIQSGHIVPIYVHLKTSGDQMHWTFLSLIAPSHGECETYGRCGSTVQGLSHRVTWGADGALTVLGTERRTGPGFVIDRAEMDGAHILNPIDALVREGTLELTATGGTLSQKARRVTSRTVQLVPATLTQLRDALNLMLGFEMSMVQLNQCGLRQILAIQNNANRSALQQQVLNAARYASQIAQIEAAVRRIPEDPSAAEQEQKDVLRRRLAAYTFASVFPQRDLVEAANQGTRLSVTKLLALARDAVAPLAEDLPQEALTELFETHRAELLASMRYSSRFVAAIQAGKDPMALVCRDITLAR